MVTHQRLMLACRVWALRPVGEGESVRELTRCPTRSPGSESACRRRADQLGLARRYRSHEVVGPGASCQNFRISNGSSSSSCCLNNSRFRTGCICSSSLPAHEAGYSGSSSVAGAESSDSAPLRSSRCQRSPERASFWTVRRPQQDLASSARASLDERARSRGQGLEPGEAGAERSDAP